MKLLGDAGRLIAVSSAWQSPSFGATGQPDYLNAAVILETKCTPAELYNSLFASIEQQLQRRRDPKNRFAARTIDIDLSLYNRQRLQVGGRVIPDPDVLRRAFVAVPLAEIAPSYRHPENNQSLRSIARRLREEEFGRSMQRRADVGLLGQLQKPGHGLSRQGTLLHSAR